MTRVSAVVCAVLVVVAAAIALRGDDTHDLHLRFADAGQLVSGDRVTIGTRRVGSIRELSLSRDGQADVAVRIDDDAWPLHRGTKADIRLTSQVGVANRYVELLPGDVRARPLRDGEVVGTDYTRGVVDIDQVLDDFTPKVRNDLRAVLRGSEEAIDGVVPQARSAIAYSAPALAQAEAALGELTAGGGAALGQLIGAGSKVSSALASNAAALSGVVDSTSRVLAAAAAERAALASVLDQAPRVLPDATRTLRRLRTSLDTHVTPTLRRVQPLAEPLATVLRRLPLAARLATPWVARLRSLLPAITLGLRRLPQLAAVAVPAMRQAQRALSANHDALSGLRQYAPDALVGGGTAFGKGAGFYDAVGHYLRFSIVTAEDSPVGSIDAALGGPTREGFSSGHHSPCPGGATESAPDKSNPRPEDKTLCNPKDDLGG
jgi:phospholipid/cholesterol/gamma-HCH transport system substrate-binding protein